ncbi:ATP-binding protein [Metabacillus hrfriensis]|uniref:ATP-binding protein n=1 Tax=Metabacillus hrfriensis TaxID=3048891 RepID=A0ACD4RI70_9BACI|nr:ATP-binding protein [Metabacillus sp. CT-WN-B3]WHZ60076.1 ATP-binding protein [Metabacillus sp. CT-WN-B3]
MQPSSERPNLPPLTHPIYTGQYLLGTNEIYKMHQQVYKWIFCRSPGGIIYGTQRIGKTRAIRYLQQVLPEQFGSDLEIFFFMSHYYSRPHDHVFYDDMLRNVLHTLDTSDVKPSRKRERLMAHLIEKGKACKQRRVIMLIDDAQRLEHEHYEWLMDMYNVLDANNVVLSVILIGQTELLNQKNTFIRDGKSQIVGRFMAHEHKVSGLRTVEDFKVSLRGGEFKRL